MNRIASYWVKQFVLIKKKCHSPDTDSPSAYIVVKICGSVSNRLKVYILVPTCPYLLLHRYKIATNLFDELFLGVVEPLAVGVLPKGILQIFDGLFDVLVLGHLGLLADLFGRQLQPDEQVSA